MLIPFVFTFLLFFGGSKFAAEGATKVSFPFTPISAASLPWWIAKEARYYEKYGLDVDMIYVGASPVIIQAMLSGQAGVGAGGGPPLVTNVLRASPKISPSGRNDNCASCHLEPFGRTQGKLRERSFPVRIIGTGAAQIDTRSPFVIRITTPGIS